MCDITRLRHHHHSVRGIARHTTGATQTDSGDPLSTMMPVRSRVRSHCVRAFSVAMRAH
jgi:hypothetical protein